MTLAVLLSYVFCVAATFGLVNKAADLLVFDLKLRQPVPSFIVSGLGCMSLESCCSLQLSFVC